MLDKLEKRRLDIVVATRKELYNKRIEYQKLFVEKFVLVQSTKSSSSLKKFTDNEKGRPSKSLLLQQN
ncbi:hypothetical protein [Abyssogena phaseoliformis symbiont]|uniref:hypothetical protein n=1 Tax=Abyssogena phaseoliformis symbiont TaxID=596095 RepID=UPI001915D63B|nr:hypothetical protein [Abyssogena phaseoliformis symbiont]MBW5289839.1 hypothetical protein [Candidatus Ruthia sp. Apha_13_S6]